MNYAVIPAEVWVHTDGRKASVYGAVPWGFNQADKPNWTIVQVGWTVRNPYTNEVGVGRPPWATQAEAQAYADKYRPSSISIGS